MPSGHRPYCLVVAYTEFTERDDNNENDFGMAKPRSGMLVCRGPAHPSRAGLPLRSGLRLGRRQLVQVNAQVLGDQV